MQEISGNVHPILNWASILEEDALLQLTKVANLPFIHRHVAAMPDAHAGKGSTVGTVIATKLAIIPAAVGVDIGCGMTAVKLPMSSVDVYNLPELRHSIERSIPTGRAGNYPVSQRCLDAMNGLGLPATSLNKDLHKRTVERLGSLGGGNHFIEICEDLNKGLWILLHSGSRHVGLQLAQKHMDIATKLNPDGNRDLAHLTEGTAEFDTYIQDMLWCQSYAAANRKEMVTRVIKDISHHLFTDNRLSELELFQVDCPHNYTQQEEHFGDLVWVTRKGAISAKAGQIGIIPGSMGAKSFIVEGLGNPLSFHSCSHGAGRILSRTQARARYTEQDLINSTQGVECRKDKRVLDEIPMSYKDIDVVMADQMDLVRPIHQLKQLICVKG